MRTNKLCFLVTSLMLVMLFVGCAKEVEYTPTKPVCISSVSRSSLFQASDDVLSSMGFVIEKFDIEAGYVKTRPLSGSQFFQVWRKDNVGAYNNAEANMHSLMRTVELIVDESSSGLCVECAVDVKRLSVQENSSQLVSQMAGTYTSGSSRRVQSLSVDESKRRSMDWIDLGRDGELEKQILVMIEKRISKR